MGYVLSLCVEMIFICVMADSVDGGNDGDYQGLCLEPSVDPVPPALFSTRSTAYG